MSGVKEKSFLYFQGFGLTEDKLSLSVPFKFDGSDFSLTHGSVVIAAITSCTNTSNPSVMLGAGQLSFATIAKMSVRMWTCLEMIKFTAHGLSHKFFPECKTPQTR